MRRSKALALVLVFSMLLASTLVMRPAHAQLTPVYFSVEPIAAAPLTNINSSINGLETPATPSPVDQNFNVEIHLINATHDNIPLGVGGVEVHFYFGNILNYCKPIGFSNMLGQSGGVLEGQNLIYAINPGLYKKDGVTPVASSPYTGAVQYMVAGASTTGGWSDSDGLVATITFQITKQPQSSNAESTVTLALENAFTDLTDANAMEVPEASVPGSLTIGATPSQQYYALNVNVVGSGSVAASPSSATYLSGTSVALTATPASDWVFDHWSGDLSGSQNPASVTMSANKTVNATFVVSTGQQYYALTVNVVGSGSVAASPSSATYLSGTSVTLTAVPAVNFAFSGWGGDLTSSQSPVNITIDANKTVTATFVPSNAHPMGPQIYVSTAQGASYSASSLGETFVVNVMINADAFWDVAGFDVNFTYDPTLINLTTASVGNFMRQHGENLYGWIDLAPGTVSVVYTKLSDAVPSSGVDTLFDVTFRVISSPTYPLLGCALALGPVDLSSWAHPEREYAPWNGLATSVDLMPYTTVTNGTYTSPLASAKHDVVVNSVAPSSASVAQGAWLSISVVVSNNGTVTETSFDVNVTYDGTLIGAQTVASLAAGSAQTLAFSWNTAGIAAGNYIVTATVTPVLGQTDLSSVSKIAVVQVQVPTTMLYYLFGGAFGILPLLIGLGLIGASVLMLFLGMSRGAKRRARSSSSHL